MWRAAHPVVGRRTHGRRVQREIRVLRYLNPIDVHRGGCAGKGNSNMRPGIQRNSIRGGQRLWATATEDIKGRHSRCAHGRRKHHEVG